MGKRVLIVDDSAAMRQLIVIALSRFSDIAVEEAGDGVAALKALGQSDFDLMVVDLNMPILDGLKLIKRVRESPKHGSVPVIVVTTEESEEAERQVRAAGATQYLRKPVNRKMIEAAVKEALNLE